jgi:hypothetical protein
VHARHEVSVVEPVLIEYLPAPQSTQALATVCPCPVVVRNLPAAQSKLVHSTEPVLVFNLPTAQAEQVPPLGPVCPILQVALQTRLIADKSHDR